MNQDRTIYIKRLRSTFQVTILFILALHGCRNNPGKNEMAEPLKQLDTIQPNTFFESKTDSAKSMQTPASPIKDKLVGKWQRSDADYVLEIRAAEADGKIDASYLNPRAINVEKAEWSKRDSRLFVNVTLRDVNYPGSSYSLQYSPLNDYLIGNYYQAIEGKNYDVLFLRKK